MFSFQESCLKFYMEKNGYCNGLGPDKIRKSNVDNTTNDEKG